jgi:hypothetical protein
LPGTFTSQNFANVVNAAIQQAPQQDSLEFLNALSADIKKVAGKELPFLESEAAPPTTDHPRGKSTIPAEQSDQERRRKKRLIVKTAREAAYAAQIHLGCTLAIAGRN